MEDSDVLSLKGTKSGCLSRKRRVAMHLLKSIEIGWSLPIGQTKPDSPLHRALTSCQLPPPTTTHPLKPFQHGDLSRSVQIILSMFLMLTKRANFPVPARPCSLTSAREDKLSLQRTSRWTLTWFCMWNTFTALTRRAIHHHNNPRTWLRFLRARWLSNGLIQLS